jgi:hypothetical protein
MHVNDCTLIKGGRESVAASENSPANLYIVEARAGYRRASGLRSLDHIERTTVNKPRKICRSSSESNQSFNQRYRDPQFQASPEAEGIAT